MLYKCPCERQRETRNSQRRGGGHVTTGAENGVMRPQAKECQQLPEAGRGKGWIFPLESQEGAQPCHVDSGL